MKTKSRLPRRVLNNSRNLRKNQTPQEVILWSRLRNRRFQNLKFRRQYPIGKYIVDFACLENKLVIEVDGCQHARTKQKEYDMLRSDYLASKGFKVLRFWDNEINDNLEGVMLKIAEVGSER